MAAKFQGHRPGALKSNHLPPSMEQKFQGALSLHRNGNITQAMLIYDELVKAYPKHFDTLHLLGVAHLQTGNPHRAAFLISRAVMINQASSSAYNNYGNALKAIGQLGDALVCYEKALALKSDYSEAYFNRGNILSELGRHTEAVKSYDKAIELSPHNPAFHNNRGNTLKSQNRYEEAIRSYEAAISLKPDYSDAHYNLAIILHSIDQKSRSIAHYEKALSATPNHADALNGLGNALKDLGYLQEAVFNYQKSIDAKPGNSSAYNNLGNALRELGKPAEALVQYELAIAHSPSHSASYINRGNVLKEMGHVEQALASYETAIKLDPDNADAYGNRGNTLNELGQFEEALASYERAIKLGSKTDFLDGYRMYMKMKIADWSNFSDLKMSLKTDIENGKKVLHPWLSLSLFDDPATQQKAAQIFVSAKHSEVADYPRAPQVANRARIKLGYFSSDFGNHPVSYLTAELYEVHDRSKFELHGFSYGPDRRGEMRDRIESAFEHFIGVGRMSDDEIVSLARETGIDVAINLNGFTEHERTGIFQKRCAPIQVNYLGYPGTMGSPCMDYVIADRIVLPKDERTHFSEKIVTLPGSFQVNDSKRRISNRVFRRAECGLPESGVVFCCFNNSYKIAPSVFDSWMSILREVSDSVLWLYEENVSLTRNLKSEASTRGVSPERLVFSTKTTPDEYLARYRLADLFLDTSPYNAGTTASDALWAGVPVLTCPGRSYVSRMAASLLNAMDLRELVVGSMNEYEAMAIGLAQNPARLRELKIKLSSNRVDCSLFSARQFARQIESAYIEMMRRYDAGQTPTDIDLSDDGCVI